MDRVFGFLRMPDGEAIQRYAARHHLRLSLDEANALAPLLGFGLETFNRLDELPLEPLELRHTNRDPGRPPSPDEDPLNAVIRFCEVTGAPSGPLHGTRVGVKDCIAVAGIPTTNGGRRTPFHVPTEDAVVVERLLDAGATIVAKTTMEDLGMGVGEGSPFGAARNPHNAAFSACGSSGGSAAAVASGLVDIGIGVDQAGSVRGPAAWCGVVGIKATHGLVPSYGLTYMNHTLDHIGPLTRTVAENAAALEVLAGSDWRDPQWVRGDPQSGAYVAACGRGIEGARIGVIQESLAPVGTTDDVVAAFEATCERLREQGAQVDVVSIPLWPDAWVIALGILAFGTHAMLASNGQGTGHLGRVDVSALEVTAAQLTNCAADLPPLLQLILLMTEHLRDEYAMTHFGRAQNLRLDLRRQVDRLLVDFDVLVTPTTPTVAHPLLDRRAQFAEIIGHAIGNTTANLCGLDLTGHPALSIPCGVGEHDLPVGFQIIGRHFDEETVYRIAGALHD